MASGTVVVSHCGLSARFVVDGKGDMTFVAAAGLYNDVGRCNTVDSPDFVENGMGYILIVLLLV